MKITVTMTVDIAVTKDTQINFGIDKYILEKVEDVTGISISNMYIDDYIIEEELIINEET